MLSNRIGPAYRDVTYGSFEISLGPSCRRFQARNAIRKRKNKYFYLRNYTRICAGRKKNLRHPPQNQPYLAAAPVDCTD